MEERKSCIYVLKKLNFVFPSTVELDYRNSSAEELWEKVNNLLEDCGCLNRISTSDLNNLKLQIFDLQERINSSNFNNDKNVDFDQNNYFIKNNVLLMKRYVLHEILKTYRNISNKSYYNDQNSNVDEIKEYISEENVRKYVVDSLTVTKTSREIYNLEAGYVANDILIQYGLNNEFDNSGYFFIYNLIEDAVMKSSNFSGELHSYGFDKVTHNSGVFNSEIQKIIDKIVNYIIKNANKLLNERIIFDNEKAKRKSAVTFSEKGELGVVDNFDNSKVKENVSLEQEEIDFEVLQSNYYKMLEIMKKNDSIIKELVELRKKITDLEEELVTNNSLLGDLRGPKRS